MQYSARTDSRTNRGYQRVYKICKNSRCRCFQIANCLPNILQREVRLLLKIALIWCWLNDSFLGPMCKREEWEKQKCKERGTIRIPNKSITRYILNWSSSSLRTLVASMPLSDTVHSISIWIEFIYLLVLQSTWHVSFNLSKLKRSKTKIKGISHHRIYTRPSYNYFE